MRSRVQGLRGLGFKGLGYGGVGVEQGFSGSRFRKFWGLRFEDLRVKRLGFTIGFSG